MVVLAGCVGTFGGQETATPAATPEATDEPTAPAPGTTGERVPPITMLRQASPTGGSGYLASQGGEPTFVAGKPVEVTVGIYNRERRPMNYTTVIQIKRLELTDSGPNVTERWNLAQFPVSVDAGESNETVQTITPNMSGEGFLRLDTLVYAGDPPATPTRENAYNNSEMQQPAFSSIPINVTTDDLTPAVVTTNTSG